MLSTFRARSNCEQEAKFVQDRILIIEKTIAELCHVFAQYSRKTARLRDKGDEIAKIASNHAFEENINKSLSTGLEKFSDCLFVLNSYGDSRVQSLEEKVVGGLGHYEEICKRAKDDVKLIYNAREKEITRKKQLDRIKERNPRNRQQIIHAETELVKASAEFSKNLQNLEEKSTEFEKQKLHDIKSILLDFISIEMGYHSRALEVLTSAYTAINSIDEEADLQAFEKVSKTVDMEFKRNLGAPNSSRNIRSRQLFRSQKSFGSLGAIFNSNQKHHGIPTNLSKSEETLDSMKHEISESESEGTISDTQLSDDLTMDSSPKVTKRFHK